MAVGCCDLTYCLRFFCIPFSSIESKSSMPHPAPTGSEPCASSKSDVPCTRLGSFMKQMQDERKSRIGGQPYEFGGTPCYEGGCRAYLRQAFVQVLHVHRQSVRPAAVPRPRLAARQPRRSVAVSRQQRASQARRLARLASSSQPATAAGAGHEALPAAQASAYRGTGTRTVQPYRTCYMQLYRS
jgi:hypothetical protein